MLDGGFNRSHTGLGGSTKPASRGHMGRSRQGAGRESDKTWGVSLYLETQVWCFGVSGLKSDWLIQTK